MGRVFFDELVAYLPEPIQVDTILRTYFEWRLQPVEIYPNFPELQHCLRRRQLPFERVIRRSSLADVSPWPPDYLTIIMGMVPYLCQARTRSKIQHFARLYAEAEAETTPAMCQTLANFWYATYLWGMIGEMEHPRPFGIFLLTYPNLFDEAMRNPRYRFTNLHAVMPANQLRMPDRILVLNSLSDLDVALVPSPILSR